MCSLDQYAAAHASAVLSDGSSRGTVALTGADRRTFLHALLTNDIASLGEGKGVYAAYLTPQGRMIADMRVIETGERLLLDVSGSVAASLAARFDGLVFSEDVQAKDLSRELDEVGVHGPEAAAIVERATGVPVAGLAHQYDNLTAPLSPASAGPSAGLMTVVRDDAFGVPGFDIYVHRNDGASLRAVLRGTGAETASDETLEVLRLEAGRPRFGVDMDAETIPLEAGIEDRAISFTKGCYVGQEVIVRVMHRGHGRVARRLVRLVLPGGAVPCRGDKVFSGDEPVGEVTSAAESPKAGAPIALAYVRRDHAAAGSALVVNGLEARLYQPGD